MGFLYIKLSKSRLLLCYFGLSCSVQRIMKRNNGRNQINDAIAGEVSIFTYALGSSRGYQLDVVSILKVKKV